MWVPPPEKKIYLAESPYTMAKLSRNKKIYYYRNLTFIVAVLLCWRFYFPSPFSSRHRPASLSSPLTQQPSGALESSKPANLTNTDGAILKLVADDAQESVESAGPATDDQATVKGPAKFSQELRDFWYDYATILTKEQPPVPLKDDRIEALINPFEPKNHIPDQRQETLRLSNDDVQALRKAHESFVEKARKLAPKLPYKKGSKGIVTTAAGEYLPELIISLRILRNSGSKLPVEVFMEKPDSDEPGICDDLLPSLNAKCFIFSDLLHTDEVTVSLSKYQFKPFAMLFSTFDDLLLLDADNLAVQPPEDLMAAEPFTETGLVTWPDYWVNVISPTFFDIAAIRDIPALDERASSESGQLLLSKSKQSLTLLLATYYNMFGYSHYYTLLSQNTVGQGDKETYLAAAMALNATFYDVKAPIGTVGFRPRQHPGATPLVGDFAGAGCLQRDPRQDANDFSADSRPAFLHAQTYKLNAARLVPRYFSDINQRMWGSEESCRKTFMGRDLEEEAWAELVWTACDGRHYFSEFTHKGQELCQTVKGIQHSLFG